MPNGSDKNFVRLCLTVDGFHKRYGYWPTRIRIGPILLEDLWLHVLGHEQFEELTKRIEFVIDGNVSLLAEDGERRFVYGRDPVNDDYSAEDWLGVRPVDH